MRKKRWIAEEFIQGKEKAVHIGYKRFKVRWTRVRIIKIKQDSIELPMKMFHRLCLDIGKSIHEELGLV
jgi:hypothetical protein